MVSKGITVAVDDPGGWSDSFCEVMAEIKSNKILLTDAIFWNKEIYPDLTTKKIKDDISKLQKHFKFDYHLCETNNTGHMIISDLKNHPYNLKITGITTSANLKTKKTMKKGTSLDKNKTVPYLQKFIEDGTIELPATMTPGLKKGIEEIQNYGVTKSGKYEALSGHDDFVSCLVILVHWALKKIMKSRASKLLGVGAGDPGHEAMKSDYDRVLDAQRRRFEGMGINSEQMDFEITNPE